MGKHEYGDNLSYISFSRKKETELTNTKIKTLSHIASSDLLCMRVYCQCTKNKN